jgi:integrase
MPRETKPHLSQIQGKWQVVLPRPDGKGRIRRTFQDKEKAETFLQLAKLNLRNQGVAAFALSPKDRVDAIEALKILRPFDVGILDAAKFYTEHHQSLLASVTVSVALKSFLAQREHDGLRPRYLKELRVRLTRFKTDNSEKIVAAITSDEIESWLASLSVGSLTRNTFRLRLSSFFQYCVLKRWCAANPCQDVRKAKVQSAAIGILTPEELSALLTHASDQTLPYWLLGAFCGLRTAELESLHWKEIHFDSGLIEVSAAKAKTASRRFVEMRPNLKAWLAPYKGRTGPLFPAGFGLRNAIKTDRKAAGIKNWPTNALRHSFASYTLAHEKDAARLALELGHSDQSLIFQHYRELVRPKEAANYWNLYPEHASTKQLVALG